jgi:hypothetical protein
MPALFIKEAGDKYSHEKSIKIYFHYNIYV